MPIKRILIITRSFYPDNWPRAFRSTELAIEFAKKGHQVTVFTHKKPIHQEFENTYNVTIRDLGKLRYKSLKETGNQIILILKKAVNRSLNWLFEYPNIELIRLVNSALRNESGYDMLISIAHPHAIHWGVARSFTKNQNITKIWIADCGDPYMGRENTLLRPPFYFKFVEKWFMRKADYITVPTKDSVDAYYPEFKDKIRIIPQGFRFEGINVYKGKKAKDTTIFGYAGMFIREKRDPSEFLAFLNSLDDSNNFEFHIYTHNPQIVEPFLKNSKDRIKLFPTIPRTQVLFELSKMDFLVNFENMGIKQTPSKLIDYAILDKPVISIKYKALNKKIVMEFLGGDFSNRMKIQNVDQYRIENVCDKFLNLGNA